MRGVFMHTFRGARAWSNHLVCPHNTVDIADIVKMTPHERLFRVFDPSLKYTLAVDVHHPHERIAIMPAITPSGIGLAFTLRTKLIARATFRYATMEECEAEMADVEDDRRRLRRYAEHVRETAQCL
jgi:hypothetical protein